MLDLGSSCSYHHKVWLLPTAYMSYGFTHCLCYYNHSIEFKLAINYILPVVLRYDMLWNIHHVDIHQMEHNISSDVCWNNMIWLYSTQ